MFVELSSFIMLEKCFFPQLARCDVMYMSQIRTFFKSSNRVFYVLHYSLCCWQLVTLVQYSLAVSPWTISLCGQGSPLVSAIRLNVLLCTCRSKCHRVWRCFLSCEINHSKWKNIPNLIKNQGEKELQSRPMSVIQLEVQFCKHWIFLQCRNFKEQTENT